MVMKEMVEVNGRLYTLQHPGNRAWLELKQNLIRVSTDGSVTLDTVKLLDYCFEHVVIPEKGDKLTIETCPLDEIEEVWSLVLQRFLRGDFKTGSYNTKSGETKKS